MHRNWSIGTLPFRFELTMKGVFSAPGDYVHFKSQVPLHKIPVCSFLSFSQFLSSRFSITPSSFLHRSIHRYDVFMNEWIVNFYYSVWSFFFLLFDRLALSSGGITISVRKLCLPLYAFLEPQELLMYIINRSCHCLWRYCIIFQWPKCYHIQCVSTHHHHYLVVGFGMA